MKRVTLFLVPIAVVSFMYGCSKDHDAPSMSAYRSAHSPDSVVATFNPAANTDNETFSVTWSMQNDTDVTDFVVAWSDSSVFDLGNVAEEFVGGPSEAVPAKQFTINVNDALKMMGDKYKSEETLAETDSLIVYFTVSAVFTNQTFEDFIGKRATVDSALVLR